MVNKYFTTEVKPTTTASLQAGSTMGNGDVLSDWTAFNIPRGAAKLVGVTVLLRGTNGARQEKSIDIYFAKDVNGIAPGSLGTISDTADGSKYQNHLIGAAHINASDYKDGLDIMAVATAGHGGSTTQMPSLVLEGDPITGTNVGYDKLYCALMAKATHNWASTLDINGTMSTSSPTLTVDTIDARLAVAPGDVLYDEDELLLGTVKSVDSATQITMESNLSNASSNDKKVYNGSPITLVLSFEK